MKSFIKKIIPRIIEIKYRKYKTNKLKRKIIKYLVKDDSEYDIAEKREIVDFMKHNPLSIMPYNFIKNTIRKM